MQHPVDRSAGSEAPRQSVQKAGGNGGIPSGLPPAAPRPTGSAAPSAGPGMLPARRGACRLSAALWSVPKSWLCQVAVSGSAPGGSVLQPLKICKEGAFQVGGFLNVCGLGRTRTHAPQGIACARAGIRESMICPPPAKNVRVQSGRGTGHM